MPEGFSSIADLKIVVDADTQKLNGNLQLAKNVVTRFSEESGQQLGFFDNVVNGLGGGITGLAAKANVWLGALNMVAAAWSSIRAQGEQVAVMGGKQTEWQELTAAIDEMVTSINEAVPAALSRAAMGLKDWALGADEAAKANETMVASGAMADASHMKTADVAALTSDSIAEDMAELSRLSRQSSNDVVDANEATALSFTMLKEKAPAALTELVRSFTHVFKTISSESEWSAETIDREMANIVSTINSNREQLFAAFSKGDPIFGPDAEERFNKSVEDVANVLDRIATLNAAAAAKRAEIAQQERITAEESSNETFETTIKSIEKEIQALDDKAAQINMTKGEAAAFAAVMRVVNEMTAKGTELTEDAAERLGEYADRLREVADAAEATAKAKADTDAADRFMKSLDTELRGLEQQQHVLGMSTTAIAAYNAEMKLRNALSDQTIKLSASDRAAAESKIAQIRDQTEAVAISRKAFSDGQSETRTFEQSILALQRQTIAFQAKTAALYDNSEAGRVKAIVDQQLNDLAARHVSLSPERVAAIRREAEAQVDAARANEQAQKSMEFLKGYVQTATSAMDGAFRQFTESGKFNFKDMIRSMLSDAAQLTFKKGVTDQIMGALFGGGGGGGGGFLSSLFGGGGGDVGLGSWGATTTFAGMRVDGGPVDAGKMYLVGERGPEPFIPSTSGTILPNGFLQGLSGAGQGGGRVGGDIHVYVHATPELDARIESTADGVVAKRAPEIVSASMVANRNALPSSVRDVQARTL